MQEEKTEKELIKRRRNKEDDVEKTRDDTREKSSYYAKINGPNVNKRCKRAKQLPRMMMEEDCPRPDKSLGVRV